MPMPGARAPRGRTLGPGSVSRRRLDGWRLVGWRLVGWRLDVLTRLVPKVRCRLGWRRARGSSDFGLGVRVGPSVRLEIRLRIALLAAGSASGTGVRWPRGG